MSEKGAEYYRGAKEAFQRVVDEGWLSKKDIQKLADNCADFERYHRSKVSAPIASPTCPLHGKILAFCIDCREQFEYVTRKNEEYEKKKSDLLPGVTANSRYIVARPLSVEEVMKGDGKLPDD